MDLHDTYSDAEFVPITWYVFSANYGIPTGGQRFSGYGFSGTPSVAFDGVETYVGGEPSGTMFPVYQPIVAGRLGAASPLTIDAGYAVTAGELHVAATIAVDLTVPPGDYQVLVVVTEDGAHNQINLARAVGAAEPFTLETPGETVTVQQSFAVDPAWVADNLKPVVLVESVDGGGVLQAALAAPEYAGMVSVDAEPDGLAAPWQLQGPQAFALAGAGDRSFAVFSPGEYTLVWQDVPGWTTPDPNPVTLTLAQDGEITFSGQYGGGPFAPATAVGPLADDGPAAGVSLVDYDLDGDLDVFLARPGVADRLLRQDGPLSFTDVAAGELAADLATVAGTWTDFDGDGDLDVFLVRDGQADVLLRQDGPDTFAPAPAFGLGSPGAGRAASWVDWNRDGLLDVYLVQDGAANRLYGCLSQTDDFIVYSTVAGPVEDTGPGAAAPWCDLDHDGDDDVYVVNRSAANRLVVNLGTGFDDATVGQLGDLSAGAAAAWGDWDGDGWLDLYLANDSAPDRLFRNSGGTFSTVSGVNDNGPTRSAVWFDYDLDGDLDLYLCKHGAIGGLMLNEGGPLLAVPVGWDEAGGPATAAACGDLDGDGDLDLYLARDGVANAVLLNQTPPGNWIALRLRGEGTGGDAIGARVRVVAGDLVQVRQVQAGGGSLAQDPLRLHLGLGAATAVDSVVVHWPDGTVESRTGLAAGQVWTIVEGEGPTGVETPGPAVRTALAPPFPNPLNPRTTLQFTLAAAGPARLEIYDLTGRHVATLVTGTLPAGTHTAEWDGTASDGRPAASGTYLCRLAAGGEVVTRRVTVVK